MTNPLPKLSSVALVIDSAADDTLAEIATCKMRLTGEPDILSVTEGLGPLKAVEVREITAALRKLSKPVRESYASVFTVVYRSTKAVIAGKPGMLERALRYAEPDENRRREVSRQFEIADIASQVLAKDAKATKTFRAIEDAFEEHAAVIDHFQTKPADYCLKTALALLLRAHEVLGITARIPDTFPLELMVTSQAALAIAAVLVRGRYYDFARKPYFKALPPLPDRVTDENISAAREGLCRGFSRAERLRLGLVLSTAVAAVEAVGQIQQIKNSILARASMSEKALREQVTPCLDAANRLADRFLMSDDSAGEFPDEVYPREGKAFDEDTWLRIQNDFLDRAGRNLLELDTPQALIVQGSVVLLARMTGFISMLPTKLREQLAGVYAGDESVARKADNLLHMMCKTALPTYKMLYGTPAGSASAPTVRLSETEKGAAEPAEHEKTPGDAERERLLSVFNAWSS